MESSKPDNNSSRAKQRQCSCCGNTYDKAFIVMGADGEMYAFDCIECCAQVLAPRCAHCGCMILGKGVASAAANDGDMFCCSHCQRSQAAATALGQTGSDDGRAAEDFDDTADDFIG